MAEVEDEHFWYRGLRDLLLTVVAPKLPPKPRIFDAGCGTGANLGAFEENLDPSYLGGFDLSTEALEIARHKAPSADLQQGDIRDPPIPDQSLDLVLSLDVLYIPGAEASFTGLSRLVNALSPGGLFVLNLPAYDWLFSEHDVAIHTTERYSKRQVRALLERLGLELEVLTYRLCTLFPLVLLRRLPGMLRRRSRRNARSDLHTVPGQLLNDSLTSVLFAENRAIAAGHTLPFGSSVFAVGRRR